MPICGECEGVVGAGDSYCEHCGHALGPDTTENQSSGGPSQGWQGTPGPHGGAQRERPAPGHAPRGGSASGRGRPAAVGTSAPPQDEKNGLIFALTYPVTESIKPLALSGLLLFAAGMVLFVLYVVAIVGSFLVLASDPDPTLGYGLVVVGVLALLVIVVPYVLVGGYSLRLGRAAARGRTEPPAFEDWAGMCVDGLRFGGVVVGLTALVALAQYAIIVVSGDGNAVTQLATGSVGLAAAYLGPAVLSVFVGTDDFRETVGSRRVLELALSLVYVKLWLLSLALTVIVVVILFAGAISFIGQSWAFAYALLAYAAYAGYVYYAAVAEGVLPGSMASPDTAAPATRPTPGPDRPR